MKRFLISIFLMLCTVSLFSQEERIPTFSKPGKNEVILVGKIKFKNKLPIENYKRLYELEESSDEIRSIYCIFENVDPLSEMSYDLYLFKKSLKNWDLDQEFYWDTKVKDGFARLGSFEVTLFYDIYDMSNFFLYSNAKVVVPEGVKYLYVGTFEYELDFALRPVGLEIIDEYDAAVEEFHKYYDKNLTLVRGRLIFEK